MKRNLRTTSLLMLLALVIVVSLPLLGCGEDAPEPPILPIEPAPGVVSFTIEELSQFDGQEGRPAYIAVDGIVYDVSASALWAGGSHEGCDLGAMAGRDLSAEIVQADHLRDPLANMPVVGALEP